MEKNKMKAVIWVYHGCSSNGGEFINCLGTKATYIL